MDPESIGVVNDADARVRKWGKLPALWDVINIFDKFATGYSVLCECSVASGYVRMS